MLLDPAYWSDYPVYESDGKTVAVRTLSTDDEEGGIMVSKAFNISDPPAPPLGAHHCLVAEAKDANDPNAKWPHESPPPTGYDLATWAKNNLRVAERNMQYVVYKGAQYETWTSTLSVPCE